MKRRTYDRMAPFYERLTDAYAFGCLERARRWQLQHIESGMRVLYVGVGPGADALAAADKGAEVTGVDLSARMVEVASRRFADAGLRGSIHRGDLFEYEAPLPYDVVVASFLVDCFDASSRPAVVARCASFLRPGGRVLVSDTGLPRGSRVARAAWYAYHGIAYATTWVQGITPWLPVMDLDGYLRGAGFVVDDHVFHRPGGKGPVLFESITGVMA